MTGYSLKHHFLGAFLLLLGSLSGFGPAGTAGAAPVPPQGMTVALFDFANYSSAGDVIPSVMPAVAAQLRARGYRVLDDRDLNAFFIKERVRTTASVTRGLAAKLKSSLGVDAVMLGAVYTYRPDGSPQLGLSARLVDAASGLILWADFASADGIEFTKVLGLGTITEIERLTERMIERLLVSLENGVPRKELESTYRVAVMPFLNKAGSQDAGMIAAALFTVALAKSARFQPVEYGDVRDAIVRSRIRLKGELDYRSIGDLGGPLSVDGIIVGTVETYSDGKETNTPPRAIVSARLLDARRNRILWYDSEARGGDDRILLLDRGKIRTVDKVAYRTVETLAGRMAKAQWH